MAQVASVARSGVPILGSLWFMFHEDRFWFSSASGAPLPTAAAEGRQVAVLVDDFSPPDSIRQVRVRGTGRIEPHDPQAVEAIYARYLGQDLASWPSFFVDRARDPEWVLWSVSTESGMAVDYPDFRGGEEMRWAHGDLPF